MGVNMFTVYALYSPKYDKIYIGYTSNLEQRLLSHNKLGKKGWTIKYRPWEVVFTEEFETKKEAMKREKQLKSAKGRQYVWERVNQKYK
jgi:putative endonuclease